MTIKDSGKGMNHEELTAWATLGERPADPAGVPGPGGATASTPSGKYDGKWLFGALGRYVRVIY